MTSPVSEGRFYWTAATFEDELPTEGQIDARLADEESGILAWTTAPCADWLAKVLVAAKTVVDARTEGGDVLACIDQLAESLQVAR